MRVTRIITTGGHDDLLVVFDDREESSMNVNWKLLENVDHFAAAVERSFDGRTLECPGRRQFGGWFSSAVEYDQMIWQAEVARLLAREQRPSQRRRHARGWLGGLWRRLRALEGPSQRRKHTRVKGSSNFYTHAGRFSD